MAKSKSDLGEPAAEEGRLVTYIPGRDDPSEAKWRGVVFKANEPVRIKEADHIEAAKGNRFFRVEGEEDTPDQARKPTTHDEYRAHVVGWAKLTRGVEELISMWASERQLRVECEVGSDDIQWLGTIIEPRLRQMRLEEGLTEMTVAGLWVKHGILDLPWRA